MLIAIQIKSGESYFSEKGSDSIIFRPSAKHVRYWLKYSLPVIGVLYSPSEDALYWSSVRKEVLEQTKSGYKMAVPRGNLLNLSSIDELLRVYDLSPIDGKVNRLLLDIDWIRRVADGEKVVLEFEDWVNKSLPRTSIKMIADEESPRAEVTIPTIYCPGIDSVDIARNRVPWADFEMDIDAYREGRMAVYEDECYLSHDNEDDVTYYTQTFEEWYREPEGIEPVESNGTLDRYRVVLRLNGIGESFLTFSEYLFDVNRFDLFYFSIE